MVDGDSLSRLIAKNVAMRRAGARMSQGELAAKAGVSRDTVVNVERQNHDPQMLTVVALAEALGCTPNDLCGYEEAV